MQLKWKLLKALFICNNNIYKQKVYKAYSNKAFCKQIRNEVNLRY